MKATAAGTLRAVDRMAAGSVMALTPSSGKTKRTGAPRAASRIGR